MGIETPLYLLVFHPPSALLSHQIETRGAPQAICERHNLNLRLVPCDAKLPDAHTEGFRAIAGNCNPVRPAANKRKLLLKASQEVCWKNRVIRAVGQVINIIGVDTHILPKHQLR
jgi:hypothetical protein